MEFLKDKIADKEELIKGKDKVIEMLKSELKSHKIKTKQA